MPRRVLEVGAAFDDIGFLELAEPGGQQGARRSCEGREVREADEPVQDLPQQGKRVALEQLAVKDRQITNHGTQINKLTDAIQAVAFGGGAA